MNGMWGTIATGLFSTSEGLLYGHGFRFFGVQVLGVICVAAWVLVSMTVIFTIIKKTIGLRVTEKKKSTAWISTSTAWLPLTPASPSLTRLTLR